MVPFSGGGKTIIIFFNWFWGGGPKNCPPIKFSFLFFFFLEGIFGFPDFSKKLIWEKGTQNFSFRASESNF